MSDFQQNTITNRQAVLDYIDANSGGGGGQVDYTEYLAFVTQNGAVAPTASVVKNDTGFAFTYGYTNTGVYEIITTGAFPDKNKVIPYFNSNTNQGFVSIIWNNTNTLDVITTDTSAILTNSQFTGNLVIRIYN